MTGYEYADAWNFCERNCLPRPPSFAELKHNWRGGIIGSVELTDSVDSSDSPWYMGEKGFVLRNPKPIEFTPLKGRLQFFEVEM